MFLFELCFIILFCFGEEIVLYVNVILGVLNEIVLFMGNFLFNFKVVNKFYIKMCDVILCCINVCVMELLFLGLVYGDKVSL